jgi:hypothetical protein
MACASHHKMSARPPSDLRQRGTGGVTGDQRDAPRLIFFRETPKDLLSRPPLASSLQHLETSFLLISMRRYPHALVSCASAVESAIKAAFNCNQNAKFEKLLEQAQERIPAAARLDSDGLNAFRRKRNEIIHYGFTPKDDAISSTLMLETAIPLTEQYYKEFFNFNLKQQGKKYGGLLPDLDRQLSVAQKVHSKTRERNDLDSTFCFRSFSHQIRWGIRHWMLSDWQISALEKEEEGGWPSWEFKEKRKEHLVWKEFDPSWSFDCPICAEPDGFVAELDNDALGVGEVRLTRGVCVNCSLVIPANCPLLADELCLDQIAEAAPKIMKEHGVVLP